MVKILPQKGMEIQEQWGFQGQQERNPLHPALNRVDLDVTYA